MGKFDGILIATDWDGTFFSGGQLFEKNLEAIKRFQSEGGLFTVCTGRHYSFVKGFKDSVFPNTYLISNGGCCIVDPTTEEPIYRGFCDEYLFTLLSAVLTDEAVITNVSVFSDLQTDPFVYSFSEYFDNIEFLSGLNIYKVMIKYKTEDAALRGMESAKQKGLGEYIAARSWTIGLEFLKKKNAKGAALRRVGERIGARLIVGVGDYENDIDMIEDADIGYAVENACDALKAVADRITVNVRDSAIAAVIEDIEREFCS